MTFDETALLCTLHCQQWNSTFLTSSFIIEGASKKVLQFLMPQESIHNKNFYFNEQKVYYEH